MRDITQKQANRLAKDYLANPKMKYIVYNIRKRSYILHDYYQFYYRFSRRQSVWNTPIFDIEDMIETTNKNPNLIGDVIYKEINQQADNIINLKLKKEFTVDDCKEMLHYYFNGKCYLAYYDYYLGRVVLIKERDKSNDFGNLIGDRYHFIGDLHQIIQHKLDLSENQLQDIMVALMNEEKPISQIESIGTLGKKVHQYFLAEISKIDSWMEENKATQE